MSREEQDHQTCDPSQRRVECVTCGCRPDQRCDHYGLSASGRSIRLCCRCYANLIGHACCGNG